MRRFGLALALSLSGFLVGCGRGGQAAGAGDEQVPISAPSKVVAAPVTRPVDAQPPGDKLTGEEPSPGGPPRPSPAPSRTSDQQGEAEAAPSAGVAPVLSGHPRPIDDPEVIAASVLQVNDRFLTVDDILQAAGEQLQALSATRSESVFREKASRILRREIQRQIGRTLILAEAEKHLTDDQKRRISAEVEKELREMIARADGSRVKVRQELAERGTSLEYATEQYRRTLTIRRYLSGKFVPALQISCKMLWDYYRDHREEFSRPKKVQMQMIAAPFAKFLASAGGEPSEQELAAARKRARQHIAQAAEALAAGEAFEDVAKRFSRGIKAAEGGIWPMMAAGSFRDEQLEAEAFRLSEGQVSGIIETATGCYIVKARKVQPGQVLSFERAQERIEQILRDQKSAELYNDYYAELSRKATIVQSEDFFSVTVDRAVQRFWKNGQALGG